MSASKTLHSATIEFNPPSEDLMASIGFFFLDIFEHRIGNLGVMSKTSLEGTRPFSLIVSFIAFAANFNRYFGPREECAYWIFQ